MTEEQIIDLALKEECLVPMDLAAGPLKKRILSFAQALRAAALEEVKQAVEKQRQAAPATGFASGFNSGLNTALTVIDALATDGSSKGEQE